MQVSVGRCLDKWHMPLCIDTQQQRKPRAWFPSPDSFSSCASPRLCTAGAQLLPNTHSKGARHAPCLQTPGVSATNPVQLSMTGFVEAAEQIWRRTPHFQEHAEDARMSHQVVNSGPVDVKTSWRHSIETVAPNCFHQSSAA